MNKLFFTNLRTDPRGYELLLEAFVVLFWGHDGGQEELKVADGFLHGDIKGTQQRSPLIQHLLCGRLREISA